MVADPVREEAERLVAAALTVVSMAARALTDRGVATDAPECCICPVCRLISALRDPSPDVIDRIAAGAGELAAGVASVFRNLSGMSANGTDPWHDATAQTSPWHDATVEEPAEEDAEEPAEEDAEAAVPPTPQHTTGKAAGPPPEPSTQSLASARLGEHVRKVANKAVKDVAGKADKKAEKKTEKRTEKKAGQGPAEKVTS